MDHRGDPIGAPVRISSMHVRLPSLTRLALAPLLALAACAPVRVLNALEPRGSVEIVRDIAYGPDDRQRLDVYAPRPRRPHAPVVVFFYGGSWDSGRRQDYQFVGASLASRGYVAVVPDYRLYPQVRWPAFLQDSAQAVRWARDHGAAYGGDSRRLVLIGHSAGAYNAAMLTLDGRWLGAVGMAPSRDVRAVVGLAGPYDFLPLHSDRMKEIFGPPDRRPDTQPINHVGSGTPPLWLGIDAHDRYVDPGETSRLADAVKAKGGRVEVHVYPRLDHQLMIGTFAAPLRWLAPVYRDVTRYIDARAR